MNNITDDENIIKEENKAKALDFILSNCLKSGFGTLSKSEIDLILFTSILKYSQSDKKSDHELSKYLQITQQRIRNLKEKASVKYLSITRDKAIDMFLTKVESAKIDDKYIDIPINDVAVKNEIEGMLDEADILIHYQLNPKIFRIRIDDFYEFSITLEINNQSKPNRKATEKKVLAAIKALSKNDEEFKAKLENTDCKIASLTVNTLKEALVKGGFSYGIDILASLIPGGSFVSGPAKTLLEKISKNI